MFIKCACDLIIETNGSLHLPPHRERGAAYQLCHFYKYQQNGTPLERDRFVDEARWAAGLREFAATLAYLLAVDELRTYSTDSCPKCSRLIPDGFTHCGHCGLELPWMAGTVLDTAQTPMPRDDVLNASMITCALTVCPNEGTLRCNSCRQVFCVAHATITPRDIECDLCEQKAEEAHKKELSTAIIGAVMLFVVLAAFGFYLDAVMRSDGFKALGIAGGLLLGLGIITRSL
jgi:hypothetical protein